MPRPIKPSFKLIHCSTIPKRKEDNGYLKTEYKDRQGFAGSRLMMFPLSSPTDTLIDELSQVSIWRRGDYSLGVGLQNLPTWISI